MEGARLEVVVGLNSPALQMRDRFENFALYLVLYTVYKYDKYSMIDRISFTTLSLFFNAGECIIPPPQYWSLARRRCLRACLGSRVHPVIPYPPIITIPVTNLQYCAVCTVLYHPCDCQGALSRTFQRI